MFRFAIALFTLAAASLAASCWVEDDDTGFGNGGMGCTEIGCEDMLTVQIERSDGEAFPDGLYLFTFTFEDNPTAESECVLGGEGSELDCGGDLADLMIEVNPSATRFTAMYFGAPGHADVRVEYEAQVLGERTYHPSYDFVSPNGPDCPPTCSQATQDMDVAAPEEI
jgi:hypothetical protein